MALHEIHWNPSARAMVLVRNHGSGPDNGCGWDGEEVRDVEALTVAFLSEGGSLDGWDDINEVVSIDGPIGIAGDWYAADDNGTLFRVTAWCSLGELAKRGTIEDALFDAEWVGHRGTIPVCEVVRFSCVEGPSIDAIGPIGGMAMIGLVAAIEEQTARLRSAFDAFDAFAAWLDSLADHRPGEVWA